MDRRTCPARTIKASFGRRSRSETGSSIWFAGGGGPPAGRAPPPYKGELPGAGPRGGGRPRDEPKGSVRAAGPERGSAGPASRPGSRRRDPGRLQASEGPWPIRSADRALDPGRVLLLVVLDVGDHGLGREHQGGD